MESISQKIRIALIGLLVALPLFGVTQAAAQDQEFTPELYTSELSGFDVEVSGPSYEITSASLEHYQNGDGEIVNIEGEVATLEVSFFDDEDKPEDSLDAYLSGMDQSGIEYEELDRGVDGDVTYSIVLITYEGTDLLYYMQVTEDITGNVDLFETVLTGLDFFEDDIQTAQEEIAIDGTPFMEDVDTGAILDVVDAGGSDSNDDDATPDATSEPATPQNSVTFEIAGVDMDVAGDFEIDEEKIGGETIEGYTLSDDDLFAAVAVGETGFSPEDTVASFSEGLTSSYDSSTEIESFEDGDSAWTLHEIEYNNETRYLFVYADTTTVNGYETLISLEMDGDNVADSIVNVQDNISIDGQPLLANVYADEVAGLVDDGAGNDADVTPGATEDVGDDASDEDNPRDDAKLPGQNGADNTSETNNSDGTTPEATDEPTEEPVGQSGDSSWTSPIYGNDVSWDAGIWTTDLNDVDQMDSNEKDGYEFVTLSGEITAESSYIYVEFQSGENSAEDFLDYWISDEFLQHESDTGSSFDGELLSSRYRNGNAGVVIRYTADGNEYFMVREAVDMEDGSVMVITIDADVEDFSTVYETAQNSISVNSDSILSIYSVSQVERLTGD